MLRNILSALWLTVLTLVLCCVVYPALLWAAGRTVFRDQAEGSLIRADDGTVVGSRLVAQSFTGNEYFRSRPSAAGSNGYDASAASGSNLAASNPALRQRVEKDLKEMNAQETQKVPADLVTTSGSGLDPHITLDGARYQLERIVKAWAKKTELPESAVREQIETILRQHAMTPLGGLAGVPLVNVLEVNRDVESRLGKLAKK